MPINFIQYIPTTESGNQYQNNLFHPFISRMTKAANNPVMKAGDKHAHIYEDIDIKNKTNNKSAANKTGKSNNKNWKNFFKHLKLPGMGKLISPIKSRMDKLNVRIPFTENNKQATTKNIGGNMAGEPHSRPQSIQCATSGIILPDEYATVFEALDSPIYVIPTESCEHDKTGYEEESIYEEIVFNKDINVRSNTTASHLYANTQEEPIGADSDTGSLGNNDEGIRSDVNAKLEANHSSLYPNIPIEPIVFISNNPSQGYLQTTEL